MNTTSELDGRSVDTRRDAGVTTVEILSWSAMMVVAIVAITVLLQALGADVIGYVRDQIGL
jgi:hypothetical protein